MHIIGFKVAIGNWFLILNDAINVILKTIYTENITNRLTWTQNLKEIIVKHGLGDIWAISHNNITTEQPSHRQLINYEYERITDVSVQNTMSSLRNQPKIRTYLMFKEEFGMETYIAKIKNPTIRKTISKF